MDILTQPQIYDLIDRHDGWFLEEGTLKATYEFENFLEALAFVNDLAEIVEQLHHYPDILIQENIVVITTTTVTLEADRQITDRDVALIDAVEELVE